MEKLHELEREFADAGKRLSVIGLDEPHAAVGPPAGGAEERPARAGRGLISNL